MEQNLAWRMGIGFARDRRKGASEKIEIPQKHLERIDSLPSPTAYTIPETPFIHMIMITTQGYVQPPLTHSRLSVV